jgi:AcrR family transcriptional regulator
LANIDYWPNSQYNSFMNKIAVRRIRKPPAERRDEIVAAACRVALEEGLQSVTLRRVAELVGIMPGLVNHYFPVADELAATAFAVAAEAERDMVFTAAPQSAGVVLRLRSLLEALYSKGSDALSLLWLDAWQASRNRPALRAEVDRQMEAWQARLQALIAEGVEAGQFHVSDAAAAAMRILALIDGMSVQAAIPQRMSYQSVRDMVVSNSERELGLPPGCLGAELPAKKGSPITISAVEKLSKPA